MCSPPELLVSATAARATRAANTRSSVAGRARTAGAPPSGPPRHQVASAGCAGDEHGQPGRRRPGRGGAERDGRVAPRRARRPGRRARRTAASRRRSTSRRIGRAAGVRTRQRGVAPARARRRREQVQPAVDLVGVSGGGVTQCVATAPPNSRECTTRVGTPASSPTWAAGHGDCENDVNDHRASSGGPRCARPGRAHRRPLGAGRAGRVEQLPARRHRQRPVQPGIIGPPPHRPARPAGRRGVGRGRSQRPHRRAGQDDVARVVGAHDQDPAHGGGRPGPPRSAPGWRNPASAAVAGSGPRRLGGLADDQLADLAAVAAGQREHHGVGDVGRVVELRVRAGACTARGGRRRRRSASRRGPASSRRPRRRAPWPGPGSSRPPRTSTRSTPWRRAAPAGRGRRDGDDPSPALLERGQRGADHRGGAEQVDGDHLLPAPPPARRRARRSGRCRRR